jgi:hypothetical protein
MVENRLGEAVKVETGQFRKKVKLKARKSRGVRSTYVRRSDFEMRRNAEIEFFTELSCRASKAQIIKGAGHPLAALLWCGPG